MSREIIFAQDARQLVRSERKLLEDEGDPAALEAKRRRKNHKFWRTVLQNVITGAGALLAVRIIWSALSMLATYLRRRAEINKETKVRSMGSHAFNAEDLREIGPSLKVLPDALQVDKTFVPFIRIATPQEISLGKHAPGITLTEEQMKTLQAQVPTMSPFSVVPETPVVTSIALKDDCPYAAMPGGFFVFVFMDACPHCTVAAPKIVQFARQHSTTGIVLIHTDAISGSGLDSLIVTVPRLYYRRPGQRVLDPVDVISTELMSDMVREFN